MLRQDLGKERSNHGAGMGVLEFPQFMTTVWVALDGDRDASRFRFRGEQFAAFDWNRLIARRG